MDTHSYIDIIIEYRRCGTYTIPSEELPKNIAIFGTSVIFEQPVTLITICEPGKVHGIYITVIRAEIDILTLSGSTTSNAIIIGPAFIGFITPDKLTCRFVQAVKISIRGTE